MAKKGKDLCFWTCSIGATPGRIPFLFLSRYPHEFVYILCVEAARNRNCEHSVSDFQKGFRTRFSFDSVNSESMFPYFCSNGFSRFKL